MTQRELLIHIGYHKTGSTWLQEHLFSDENQAFCLALSLQETRDLIIMPNALDFDPKIVEDLESNLINKHQFPVISNERLSGNPHSGGYDSKEIADRLRACFPNGKILIVIREQKSAIFSSYIQYIRAGGPCSIQDYLYPPERGKPVSPLFDFEHFNYYRLVKYYIELFGKDRVLVLPFEDFKKDARTFCNNICDFAKLNIHPELSYREKTNKRISTFSSILLRQSNKIFAKSTLNPSAIQLGKKTSAKDRQLAALGPGKEERGDGYHKIISLDSIIPKSIHSFFDQRLKKTISEACLGKYQGSNKALKKLIGIDLEALGYEC